MPCRCADQLGKRTMPKLLIIALPLGALLAVAWIQLPSEQKQRLSLQLTAALPGTSERFTSPSEPTTVYRWRSADGSIHFSDSPPTELDPDSTVETTQVQGAHNVVSMPKPQPPKSQSQATSGAIPFPSPSTLPLSQIPKLINDAKALQEKTNERNEALQRL